MIGFACENATISYDKPTDAPSGCDPITGLPFSTSFVTESFRVSLEKDTVEATIGIQPGKDVTEHFWSGRFNGTQGELPTWYKPGGEYKIQMDNGVFGTWYAYAVSGSRLGIDTVLGISIEGTIKY